MAKSHRWFSAWLVTYWSFGLVYKVCYLFLTLPYLTLCILILPYFMFLKLPSLPFGTVGAGLCCFFLKATTCFLYFSFIVHCLRCIVGYLLYLTHFMFFVMHCLCCIPVLHLFDIVINVHCQWCRLSFPVHWLCCAFHLLYFVIHCCCCTLHLLYIVITVVFLTLKYCCIGEDVISRWPRGCGVVFCRKWHFLPARMPTWSPQKTIVS